MSMRRKAHTVLCCAAIAAQHSTAQNGRCGMRRADLDIAKGIGILLVVWAHAKAPYNSYMYLFHMPFFFLISGYLHNHKAEFGTFFKRKVVSLYLPFVGWNLAVTVLKLLENPHRWKASMQTMVEILLALEKDGEFFGATWFLASLFWVAVIYKAGETLLSRYSWGPTALDLAFVGAGVLAFTVNLPYMQSRTVVLGLFYALGVAARRHAAAVERWMDGRLALVAAVLFVVSGHYNSANMGANEYRHPVLFVVGALLASYALLTFAKLADQAGQRWRVCGHINGLLCYFSRRSIDLVIWQFVAFRAIIFLQLALNHLPLSQWRDYYPVYDATHGWWLAYFLCGVVGSLVIAGVFRWLAQQAGKLVGRTKQA